MNGTHLSGGSGSTVIEGSVNEFARVTVNGASAQLSKDPVGDGFRYRRTVPVTPGSNTVTVSATDTGGATTTKQWQFNVPATSRSFSYDANGNTLSDGQRTMTWDVKNRLRTVTKAGTTWKWDYDYQDRRVKEYQNNTLTKIFIWSGTEVVQERDASGAVVTRYDYTSYQGPVKVSGTVEATFQTIGRYYHHTGSGLEMALYRAYDPELGRWLNEDPFGERGGLNLYGYVGNGPVMAVDPLGLQACLDPLGMYGKQLDGLKNDFRDLVQALRDKGHTVEQVSANSRSLANAASNSNATFFFGHGIDVGNPGVNPQQLGLGDGFEKTRYIGLEDGFAKTSLFEDLAKKNGNSFRASACYHNPNPKGTVPGPGGLRDMMRSMRGLLNSVKKLKITYSFGPHPAPTNPINTLP